MCSSRFAHPTPLHHSSITKRSAERDVWLVRVPLCWVDRRGTMALLCCLSIWPPSCSISARGTAGFWLCELCWPGLCLLVTDPLCPQCLQLVRPLRAADYPTVIGAWALADQRCPADCGALVIFHPLMLCSACLHASSFFLPACPDPVFGQRGKDLTSAGFIIPFFFIRHDRTWLSFPCPFEKRKKNTFCLVKWSLWMWKCG